MADDRELVRRSLDFQSRSRDYRMVDLPGYWEWSRGKLSEGEPEAYIEHMDGCCMQLLPEDAARMTGKDYDEILKDLKEELKRGAT